jgi:hypothetical protein
METNPVLEDLPNEPSPDGPNGAEVSSNDNLKVNSISWHDWMREWRDYMAPIEQLQRPFTGSER